MDGRDWVQVIGAITAGIVLVINTIMAWKNSSNIEQIHLATNSMKDALVKVTGESEKAKGRLEGAAEEQKRLASAQMPQKKLPGDPSNHL